MSIKLLKKITAATHTVIKIGYPFDGTQLERTANMFMKTLRDFIIQSLQDLNVSEAHYDMYEKELFVMDNLSEDKKVKFIQKMLGSPYGKIIVGDQYVSPSRYRVAFEFYNENEICFTIYAMDIQNQTNIDLIRSKIADCIAHVR